MSMVATASGTAVMLPDISCCTIALNHFKHFTVYMLLDHVASSDRAIKLTAHCGRVAPS